MQDQVPLEVVVSRMDEGASNTVIVSGGIAQRLVAALASLVRHSSGGLGIVLVFAINVGSGISGSKTADMAAVAPLLFPEMRRR